MPPLGRPWFLIFVAGGFRCPGRLLPMAAGQVLLMKLFIIKPGSSVIIGEIEAVVTGVIIKGDSHVAYECAWWDDRDRCSDWFEAFEVRLSDESHSVDIGFQVS